MSAESQNRIEATLNDCGGSTRWIWEQEDDLWGYIRLKSSNKILTAIPGGKWKPGTMQWIFEPQYMLELKDLNVEATRDRQRWRWVGDLLVSKAHIRSVLTLDQNGLMMVETKGKDGTWNQQWEMALAEDESDKPSGPIPKGKCLLKKTQAALDKKSFFRIFPH